MTTLEQLAKTIERGFGAISGDVASLSHDVDALRHDMVTADDVRSIVESVVDPLNSRMSTLEHEVRDARQKLNRIEDHVGHMRGFSKEIDHLSDRLRRIEKHLGLERSIAA